MKLNTLPDVVLRLIFDRVPLSNLFLNLPLVCHRWAALQPSAIRSKRSLTLLIGENPLSTIINSKLTIEHANQLIDLNEPIPSYSLVSIREIEIDQLRFPTLNRQQVDRLIREMPNVESLLISIAQSMKTIYNSMLSVEAYAPISIQINCAIDLMESLSPRMKSLKIFADFWLCRFNHDSENFSAQTIENLARLLKTINSMPKLAKLSIDMKGDNLYDKMLNFDLPVLSQLVEFGYASFNEVDFILNSLCKYGEPNENLRKIGLSVSDSYSNLIAKFSQTNLADRITLFTDKVNLQSDQMTNQYFNLLTTFKYDLSLCEDDLLKFTEKFAFLFPNLVHLALRITNNNKELHKHDRILNEKFIPLRSVKLLTFYTDDNRNHFRLYCRHWARIFPSVQVVAIYRENVFKDRRLCCQRCFPRGIKTYKNSPNQEFENAEKIRNCENLLIDQLRMLPMLRKVYLHGHYSEEPEKLSDDDYLVREYKIDKIGN